MEKTKADGARNYYSGFGRGQSSNRKAKYEKLAATGNNFNFKGFPEEKLQLVPCRWSHTGWKYVQCDPEATNFFSNPNKVNNIGFSGVR